MLHNNFLRKMNLLNYQLKSNNGFNFVKTIRIKKWALKPRWKKHPKPKKKLYKPLKSQSPLQPQNQLKLRKSFKSQSQLKPKTPSNPKAHWNPKVHWESIEQHIPGIAIDQLLDVVHLPWEEWRLEDLVNLKLDVFNT